MAEPAPYPLSTTPQLFPPGNPPTLDEVTPAMVERFFEPVWPEHAHPLRHLD